MKNLNYWHYPLSFRVFAIKTWLTQLSAQIFLMLKVALKCVVLKLFGFTTVSNINLLVAHQIKVLCITTDQAILSCLSWWECIIENAQMKTSFYPLFKYRIFYEFHNGATFDFCVVGQFCGQRIFLLFHNYPLLGDRYKIDLSSVEFPRFLE